MNKKILKIVGIVLGVCVVVGIGVGILVMNIIQNQKPENVKEVESLISNLGEITKESSSSIEEAENKYKELNDEEKASVENYEALTKARQTYEEMVEAEKVAEVENAIKNIGEVTISKNDVIKEARTKYTSLTSEQKKKITNYSTLEKAESTLKDLKKKQAASKLSALSKTYDKMEGITWYMPKNVPEYINTRCYILPYIGVSDNGNSWLCVRYNYTEDDWVFWTKATILIDGERHYKYAKYSDVERDNKYGDVWETLEDTNVSETDIEMLKKIANSKETTVRFEGSSKYWDFKVTKADKTSIKQVLAAYEALI